MKLNAALDWLLERQPTIETALAKRHLNSGTLVLYDVLSSYMGALLSACQARLQQRWQEGYAADHLRSALRA